MRIGLFVVLLLVASGKSLAQETVGNEKPLVGPAVSAAGTTGQRQTRDQVDAIAAPTARIASRIENRVQSRIQNRIDRNFDASYQPASPFAKAQDRVRAPKRTTR